MSDFVTILNRLARPYLAILISTLYNVALLWAVVSDILDVKEYILAVGPANAMIIGFLFGERAALKRPNTAEARKQDEEQ